MSWEKSSYTAAGAALLSESISGSALTITRATSGTGMVDTDLSEDTIVSGETHELTILAIDTVKDGEKSARKVSIQITGAENTYIMHQIGVYGRLNGGDETLLFLMQDERGIEVPAHSTSADFEIELDILLAISNSANIGITISPQIKAIMRMVQQYIQEHCVQLNCYQLTLTADGWKAGSTPGYPYQYTAKLDAAKEADLPVVQPESDSLAVAEDAGLASACETSNGAIAFWAESIPESDIRVQVMLLGYANNSTVVETTSALGRALLGSLALNM